MTAFGNLVVTLFALALGLGSLKIAAEGLFTGAVQRFSRRGTDLVFSSNPLGFLFLEAAWIGLGSLCLLLAWRCVVRPRGHDDDGDDDEDRDDPPADPAVPLPRKAHQRATAGRTATVPAPLPLPSPSPSLARASEPTAAATSRASRLPAPLRLYMSKRWAVFLMVFFTACTVGAAYCCLALAGILGAGAAKVVFALWALVYLTTLWRAVRNLRWEGPALELDVDGITDHRRDVGTVLWTDLTAVGLHTAGGKTSLVVSFRHLADAHAYFGTVNALGALVNRIFFKGFEGRIALTSLSFRRAEVLATAQAFLRNARRRS